MADIQIIIGYETVTQADQAFKILDKTVNSTARQYEQAFNRITSWQKKFSNEQNKVNASLNTQHLAQQKSNKSARDSAKAFEDAARAVEKEAAALRSLRMATDSVYRNQQKRLQMKKLLKSAIAAETMTTQQAIVALKRYNAAQMSSTKVMGMAKNKMNGNNMAIQQLGYQFGDFAVQVQGGTSAFVAFSQQGAQLAGILPMVAGPLGLSMGAAVGLSAALGILIPIGSAVGRMFFEMRDSAKEAADEIASFEEVLKSAKAETFDMVEALRLLKSGFETESELALNDALVEARDNLRLMLIAKQNVADAGFESDANRLVAEASAQKAVDAAQALLDLARENFKAHRDAAAALEKEERRQERNASVINQLHEVRQTLQREAREEAQKYADIVDKVVASQADQIALASMILATNKDHVEVAKLRAEQEGISKGLIGEELAEYILQEMVLRNIVISTEAKAKAVEESALAAAEFAKVDISAGVKAAAEAAQRLATHLGVSLRDAMAMQGLISTRVTRDVFDPRDPANQGSDAALERTRRIIEEGELGNFPLKPNKPSGGGGKSPQEQLAEYLEGKRQELELETKLVGIFGTERSVKSELFEIEQKYGNLIDTTQDSQLAGTLRQIEAEKERNKVLKEAVADQQSIADTLQSSMSDAFMSMVDGTKSFKDAMKDMARSVIKQLYEVLVVQQMVGNFNATTKQGSGLVGMIMGAFQADGGAWQGGSQIQAYANGGVVGGPTTFPMAGGKTGLMGEAGPEAIMPLKRGSNGKLGVQMEGGGGDTINVVQNFNFQANGDDTVKKLIAQAAPKIAQMTKSSLLDDRRRGGSTKAAFG